MTNNYNHLNEQSWDTIVIGGGQAGLAAGYYLSQLNEDFLILDANENTGDSWRNRWESLRLFTPAWINGLPGMPFPASREHFATKNEVADFLAAYKETYHLPVLHNSKVTSLCKSPTGYKVSAGEQVFDAKSVVITTGNYNIPKIPAFAGKLNPVINQVHSSRYISPSYLPDGDVLVVGAGTSGLQIAMDLLNSNRSVSVSGTPPFRIPDFIFKYFAKQFVWFTTNILNTSTPMGRKAQLKIKAGGAAPLVNISLDQVKKAGAESLSRITSVSEGWPVTETEGKIKPANIIWATGFNPDYSWVNLPGITDEHGYPITARGVSTAAEGLYFVGSMFQYGLTSTWLGGVGRDAEYVCRHVHEFNKEKPGS